MTACDSLLRPASVHLYDESQSDLGDFVTFQYDTLSRRSRVDYVQSGASTAYAYESDSALDSLDHTFVAGADYTADYGYNADNQLTSLTNVESEYTYVPLDDEIIDYLANDLNQYTSVDDQTTEVLPAYDDNGNPRVALTLARGQASLDTAARRSREPVLRLDRRNSENRLIVYDPGSGSGAG